MAQVTINKLCKSFGNTTVVEDFSLEIEDGEFVALVGPSGCGKSTMLKMLAGLEMPDSGSVHIGNRDVTYADPGNRDIAMVFQSYALYPHLTVQRNMEFGLRMQGVARRERASQVMEVAEVLGITDLLQRRPSDLSGGQRQRVALGRAIVRKPLVFLMDEPLSNLDAKLRVHMRAEISTMHRRVGVTTIYVTHDQTEAMTMANRIVVLHGGTVQQTATPQEMYDNPVNMFVAGFIGTPSMNFIRCKVTRSDHHVVVDVLGSAIAYQSVEVGESGKGCVEIIVGIRPEHFVEANAQLPVVSVMPRLIEHLGSEKLVHFESTELKNAVNSNSDELDLNTPSLVAKLPNSIQSAENQPLKLGILPSQLLMFDTTSHKRLESSWVE